MPNKYFSIDGVATWVHHGGPTTLPGHPPNLSRGRTVLCLHGAGGNGNVFAGVMERLATDHSPLAFDQPGHARSGSLDSLGSIERMAGFTRAFATALGLERPVLLGHSMGGAVAIRYALDHPEDVRALVLSGTGASFAIPDELLEQTRRVTEGKERRQFSREVWSPVTPPEVVRKGIMEEIKTDPRVLYGDLLACRDWDATADIESIELPTLVVVGEDDMDWLREQSDLLASRIRGARKVVIPKAGHRVLIEQPEAVADAVAEFLGGLES